MVTYQQTLNGTSVETIIPAKGPNEFTAAGLLSNTQYTFIVEARNSEGLLGPAANITRNTSPEGIITAG